MKQGCVYLVGAGCGKADLITLRGKKLLENCDCVVCDDLIDSAVLNFAPAEAQRIYMGKREGRHSAKQKEISATLVKLAAQGKIVVRLKGGDPFVFGRGGEEILALKQAGIPFEEVPGISSAIAIPAGAGIPVTHRGLSRSVHIITGHTADTPDDLPADLFHLAKSDGTLVFLMGLSKLELIAQKLLEYGRAPDTPAAVISGGNSPNPATVRGTLNDIAVKARGVCSPAVIVVGNVAALDLSPTICLPLQAVRVGVTGTRRMCEKLAVSLESLGSETVELSRTKVKVFPPDSRLTALASPEKKWLVFTSPNGVQVFFDQLRAMRLDVRKLDACRFAAIGPVTAAALEEHGIFPELCPEKHTSAGLAQALIETVVPDEEIYLLRSAKGAAVLKELPEQIGFSVMDIPLYDTIPDPNCPVLDEVSLNRLDYLVFSSMGGVEEFFLQYKILPQNAVPVCIGPVTSAALSKHTERPPLVAKDTGADHIMEIILQHQKKELL